MRRIVPLALTAAATAAAFLTIVSGAEAQDRYRRGYVITGERPLTVTRRSWLDPGAGLLQSAAVRGEPRQVPVQSLHRALIAASAEQSAHFAPPLLPERRRNHFRAVPLLPRRHSPAMRAPLLT
jgi:hypothetical protein